MTKNNTTDAWFWRIIWGLVVLHFFGVFSIFTPDVEMNINEPLEILQDQSSNPKVENGKEPGWASEYRQDTKSKKTENLRFNNSGFVSFDGTNDALSIDCSMKPCLTFSDDDISTADINLDEFVVYMSR